MTLSLSDIGDYADPRGRPVIDPELFKQPGTFIIGGGGQSMRANYSNAPAITPEPYTVFEMSNRDGKIYPVTDGFFPTMGMDGGSGAWVNRRSVAVYHAAMRIQRGHAKRVLIVSQNIGGTTAGQWSPAGPYMARQTAMIQHLVSLGLMPTVWCDILGQADVKPDNPMAATNAQNFSDLMCWRWQVLRGTGLTCPIIMGRGAYWSFKATYPDRYAMVKAGQALSVTDANNGTAGHPAIANVHLGPDDDEWPSGTGWRVDDVHQDVLMRACEEVRWNTAISAVVP